MARQYLRNGLEVSLARPSAARAAVIAAQGIGRELSRVGGVPVSASSNVISQAGSGAIPGLLTVPIDGTPVNFVAGGVTAIDETIDLPATAQDTAGDKVITRVALVISASGEPPTGWDFVDLVDAIFQLGELQILQGARILHQVNAMTARLSKYKNDGGIGTILVPQPGNFPGTHFRFSADNLPAGTAVGHDVTWRVLAHFENFVE